MKTNNDRVAANALYALGGLVALVLGALIVHEIPSMRRELRLMRM